MARASPSAPGARLSTTSSHAVEVIQASTSSATVPSASAAAVTAGSSVRTSTDEPSASQASARSVAHTTTAVAPSPPPPPPPSVVVHGLAHHHGDDDHAHRREDRQHPPHGQTVPAGRTMVSGPSPGAGMSSATRTVSCSSVGESIGREARRLRGHRVLEQVAGRAAVAEALVARDGVEPDPRPGAGARIEPVAALLGQRVDDRQELVGGVVGEVDHLREPRPQARVRADRAPPSRRGSRPSPPRSGRGDLR